MITFFNENILKTIFRTYTLFDISHNLDKIANRTICREIILKNLNNKSIFKSIGISTTILNGHSSSINSLALLPNNNIISASNDKTLKIWNIKTNHCLTTMENNGYELSSLIILANGNIATCSNDDQICIWSGSYECIRTIKIEGYYLFYNLLQLPNGNLAFAAFKSHIAYILILDSKNNYNSYKVINANNIDHTFFVNGSYNKFSSIFLNKSINICDIDNEYNCVKTIKKCSGYVTTVAYINRYELLISGTVSGTINVYDINRDYKHVKRIEAHHKGINCLLSLPSGYFASSGDNIIKFWDLKNYGCINTLQCEYRVDFLLVLKDRRIASASKINKAITIYNY
jgi:WD40 repeat protein